MRKLLPLFACLMLVLTGWSGMAHAAEAVGGTIGGFEFSVHAPGDGDEVPADSDNGLPHHHAGCHGHDIGTPATAVVLPLAVLQPVPLRDDSSPILTAADQTVAQRPPRA